MPWQVVGQFGTVRPAITTARKYCAVFRSSLINVRLTMRILQQSKQIASTQLAVLVAAIGGCASLPFDVPAPFRAKEKTSIITPSMRADAIREIAARSERATAEEQMKYTQQLATQIQTESDPLVRQAIQETIAEFETPLARDVLVAGLNDSDLDVRITCCEKLQERPEPTVVDALRAVVKHDESLDVRLAAVEALGHMRSPASVAALALAVNDRDPAMQYAGVQSLKAISAEDLGNDVEAWRQYVSNEQPELKPPVSVAKRDRGWSPF